MHPRYISTSFVSFPFLFSILPPLFLSYLPSQRQLSRDTSRVARTHTHTRARCRFTLGDPCRTNERTHTRLGETATYTRGMCLEGTVVANYFVSPCLLDSEQLQLDSNACKEILDDDNSSSKIPYRFRRKEKFNPPPPPRYTLADTRNDGGKTGLSSRHRGFPRYSHATHAKVSESIIFVHNAYRTGSGRSNLPHLPRGLASLRGRQRGGEEPSFRSLFDRSVILFFVRDSIAPPLPFLSPSFPLHLLTLSLFFSSRAGGFL